MQPITIQFAVRVREDYKPLHVYLRCVWVVIYVKYITYEGLLHNTLAHSLCEWFRNLSKRNVVRETAAVVELNL